MYSRALAALRQRSKDLETCEKCTSVSESAAVYVAFMGRMKEGQKLISEAIERMEEIVGPEDRRTLHGIARSARLVKLSGRWYEAESIKEQLLETRTRVLSRENRGTVTVMMDLPGTYIKGHKYAEAETLLMEIGDLIHKKKAGSRSVAIHAIYSLGQCIANSSDTTKRWKFYSMWLSCEKSSWASSIGKISHACANSLQHVLTSNNFERPWIS